MSGKWVHQNAHLRVDKKGIYSDSLLTLVFHKLRSCIKELLAFAEEKKDMPALKGKQARALYACMHLFR